MLCFPLQFLTEWINRTLKEEHIVVKNLEEDLYDGLVLHHLLGELLLRVYFLQTSHGRIFQSEDKPQESQ